MLHCGMNIVHGVPVEVAVKRVSRINLRIGLDGVVKISVPRWRCTLHEAESFLFSKWKWVEKVRRESAAKRENSPKEADEADIAALQDLLSMLVAWRSLEFEESGVRWNMRRMKSVWGSCHWRKRELTFNSELAVKARDLVDYVVVHELTHLKVHDHGPSFYALMDERLPGWRDLRRRLNRG